MGVPNTSVVADGDPATRAAVRSAALERFTRLITDADSATRTLAAWRGEPPTMRIHAREEAATLPKEAMLEYDDQDRAVLLVSAALEVATDRVALVEETYLEPVLW
jgi:hypothetical protein